MTSQMQGENGNVQVVDVKPLAKLRSKADETRDEVFRSLGILIQDLSGISANVWSLKMNENHKWTSENKDALRDRVSQVRKLADEIEKQAGL